MLTLTYNQAVFTVDHFAAIVTGGVVVWVVFAFVWRWVVLSVCDFIDRIRPRV